MNCEQEILIVLTEAGEKGLSVGKIAKHVYNRQNGLFCSVSFDEVRRKVASCLYKNSKSPKSIIQRMDTRGFYKIRFTADRPQQLMFDFKADEPDNQEGSCNSVDLSLSLFT